MTDVRQSFDVDKLYAGTEMEGVTGTNDRITTDHSHRRRVRRGSV